MLHLALYSLSSAVQVKFTFLQASALLLLLLFMKFIGASYSEGKIFYWYFRESCKMWALRQECWTKTQSRHLQAFCWWVTPSSWPENSPGHCEGAEEFEIMTWFTLCWSKTISHYVSLFPLPNKGRNNSI